MEDKRWTIADLDPTLWRALQAFGTQFSLPLPWCWRDPSISVLEASVHFVLPDRWNLPFQINTAFLCKFLTTAQNSLSICHWQGRPMSHQAENQLLSLLWKLHGLFLPSPSLRFLMSLYLPFFIWRDSQVSDVWNQSWPLVTLMHPITVPSTWAFPVLSHPSPMCCHMQLTLQRTTFLKPGCFPSTSRPIFLRFWGPVARGVHRQPPNPDLQSKNADAILILVNSQGRKIRSHEIYQSHCIFPHG